MIVSEAHFEDCPASCLGHGQFDFMGDLDGKPDGALMLDVVVKQDGNGVGALAQVAEVERVLLAGLEQATAMLAVLQDPQEILRISDDAERASVLARLHGLDHIADQYKALTMRCQRQWASITPAKPGKASPAPAGDAPDLTRRQKGKARELAAMPDGEFDAAIEDCLAKGDVSHAGVKRVVKQVRQAERQAEVEAERQAYVESVPKEAGLPDGFRLIHSPIKDLRWHIPAGTLDAIITDPPYDRAGMAVFGDLADFAGHALRDGGVLVVLMGNLFLPDALLALQHEDLAWVWQCCYLMADAHGKPQGSYFTNQFKPVLVYAKGKPDVGHFGSDVIIDPAKQDAGKAHKWAQSQAGTDALVSRFLSAGQIMADPFCGSGTTGVSAMRIGAHWIGADADEDATAIAKGKLLEEVQHDHRGV